MSFIKRVRIIWVYYWAIKFEVDISELPVGIFIWNVSSTQSQSKPTNPEVITITAIDGGCDVNSSKTEKLVICTAIVVYL